MYFFLLLFALVSLLDASGPLDHWDQASVCAGWDVIGLAMGYDWQRWRLEERSVRDSNV